MPNKDRRARLLAALVGALTLSALAASPAAAQGTLTGEALVCSPGSGGPVTNILDPRRFCDMSNPTGGSEPNITEAACDADGGRFRYEADGTAVGPYPGTFEEAGTVTAGPGGGFSDRQLLTLEAEFTIHSAQGEVTGRKRLPEPVPITTTTRAICVPGAGIQVFALSTALCYQANLPGGDRDRGSSELIIGRSEPGQNLFDQFLETFTSDPGVGSCGFEPQTKEECKDGGFKDFPGFKNQGDCVSFVATKGKNEPGKNQKK
jgi:hypothetical protein